MQEKKLFPFQEIKQKIVNYCVYQDRCHAEVEQKMKEFLLIPEAKEEILLYLIKENYLNEERFTRSYVRGKFYIKKWGRNKIKVNLLQKGISEKLIIPTRQVKANKQKQKVKRKLTIPFKAMPGVNASADDKNRGRRSSANQASASLPVQICAITTTNPVKVQITMVSKKTPID